MYFPKFSTRDPIVLLRGQATTQKIAQPSKKKSSHLPTVLADTSTFNPVISFDSDCKDTLPLSC